MNLSQFIILSAQPDHLFYEWQLEIQFINLSELGYDLSNYHVLIGFRQEPSRQIKELVERYPRVNWNFYQDTRDHTRSYVSSLRPHIIRKHYTENPYLEGERVFYIDSDVIFRELPPLHKLNAPENWYFSRADYVSINTIKTKGEHILTDMCRIVGIDRELVEAKAGDGGGAQSWLSGVNADFWNKLEIDSTRLHDYLKLT